MDQKVLTMVQTSVQVSEVTCAMPTPVVAVPNVLALFWLVPTPADPLPTVPVVVVESVLGPVVAVPNVLALF